MVFDHPGKAGCVSVQDKYIKSNELLERALKVTPLGAQTFSKSYRYYCRGNSPLYLERGKGCYVWDVDGNRYIDFICALGAVSVGYDDERVNQAVLKQMEKGVSFSQPVEIVIQLAEKLTQILPCAEMVRFVKNGSDATASAVRLARAFTGRDIILCCGYHGMHDWYISSTVNHAGIPEEISRMTLPFKYNDLGDLKKTFQEHSGKIAAVIMEPLQGNGPEEGYLQEVKRLTHENGAVLIFDEVVSGFRYALGGASELFGVTPDLAAYGKGLANGFPLSVVVGKREILELIAKKPVFISTTFGDEAASIAAALETIKILEQPGVFVKTRALGKMLMEQLNQLIVRKGLADIIKIMGLAPHGILSFNGQKSLDYLDIASVFQQEMVDHGILTLSATNLNTCHTDQEIYDYINTADKAFDQVSRALEQDSTDGILIGRKIDPVFRRNI
jgi:glutamate-1-semialdehyde 2,1-aminomutase